jgi:hypothetical protein
MIVVTRSTVSYTELDKTIPTIAALFIYQVKFSACKIMMIIITFSKWRVSNIAL